MPNYTKLAIKESFIKQLGERPLKQITVRSIVEDCGINRNSFYYHYQDIPALIQELVREEADKIIAAHPTVDSLEEGINAVADFASENRRAIMHIYRSANRDIFENELWKVCDYIVTAYASNLFRDRTIDEADRKSILEFFKCQLFGLCIAWLNRGGETPDETRRGIARLCMLQYGVMEEMIRRCSKKPHS